MFDGHVVLYKSSLDVFIYFLGAADENELILSATLQSFQEALAILLGQVEKRTIMENVDMVMLALDETIDDGYCFYFFKTYFKSVCISVYNGTITRTHSHTKLTFAIS